MSNQSHNQPDVNRADYHTKWLEDGLYWAYGDIEWHKCDPQPHIVSHNQDYEAKYCEGCVQMTNHLDGVCQKSTHPSTSHNQCTAPGVEWSKPDDKGVTNLLICGKPAKLYSFGKFGGILCERHAKMIAGIGVSPIYKGKKASYIA